MGRSLLVEKFAMARAGIVNAVHGTSHKPTMVVPSRGSYVARDCGQVPLG